MKPVSLLTAFQTGSTLALLSEFISYPYYIFRRQQPQQAEAAATGLPQPRLQPMLRFALSIYFAF